MESLEAENTLSVYYQDFKIFMVFKLMLDEYLQTSEIQIT